MKKRKIIWMLLLPLALLVSCGEREENNTSSPTEAPADTSKPDEEQTRPDGKKVFVFEAENSADIEDLEGNGFSGTATGISMIQEDRSNLGASGGMFVGYLYKPGLTITFDITSDKAVTDAILDFRVATQFYNIPMSPNTYDVSVNNESISYEDFELKVGSNSQNITPFEDHTLTTSLSLKQGVNHFAFITNNNNALGGTMSAEAPIFDCFKITTDATLTWNPTIYF